MTRGTRLAVLIPSNNTTVVAELPRWLPAGVAFEALRIPRPPGLLTPETVPTYVANACDLAESLVGRGFDLVVYACTAASFILGPRGDENVARQLGAMSGLPALTTASAMVAALSSVDARNIALVTPYSNEVNERLCAYLAKSGVSVRRLGRIEVADVESLGRVSEAEVEDKARATMTDDCDALFIACAQLPTAGFIGLLERDFGRPAWSSVQATAWRACAMLEPGFAARSILATAEPG